MMAVVMLLQWLAQHEVRLQDVVASLPPIHTVSSTVHCAWDSKGAVMRRLQSQASDSSVQMIDGIKVSLEDERWVLIRPDPDRPLFHERRSRHRRRSRNLLAEYSTLVAELVQLRSQP